MGSVVDSTDRYLEGSPLDRNIFTALIVAAIIVLALRGGKVGTLLRANAPIVSFLLYCGLSIIWCEFRDVAFKRWIRAVGDFAMVLIVLSDPSPLAAVESFLSRVGFAIVPLSILYDLGRGFSGRGWHYGLTVNKNMYGLIGMVLGIAATWRFLTILRDRERGGSSRAALIAHGSLLALTMWCLWSSNSVTSMGCFVLGSILIIGMRRWSLARKPALVHFVMASLILLALYAEVLNPNVGIVSAIGKDPTLTGRTDLWPSVIAMSPSSWFGAGYESFWLGPRLKNLWNIFVWRPNEAHNGYIEVYLNLGWTGVMLLGVVLLSGYRRIVRGLRQDTDTNSLWLAYFLVAVVYNLTEAGFRMFSPIWIVLLLSISAVFKPPLEKTSSLPATTVPRPFPKPRFRDDSLVRHRHMER